LAEETALREFQTLNFKLQTLKHVSFCPKAMAMVKYIDHHFRRGMWKYRSILEYCGNGVGSLSWWP
jgi:hypothetical protein